MDDTGIELILARSPQANGRVERMAGTFQDRLVTELRLAGASTIADANRVLSNFLPRFNEQFRVPARNPTRHTVLSIPTSTSTRSSTMSTTGRWPGTTR